MRLLYVLTLFLIGTNARRKTPAAFDVEDIFTLSEPGSVFLTGVPPCYASALFAITTALEIHHHVATGNSRQFSVQQMVDCHVRGCTASYYDDYVSWLIVNDHLAPAANYTDYHSQPRTCRAGTSVDGLTDIRVEEMRTINILNFQAELLRHGSVLSCIDTSQEDCYGYKDYTGGIMDGHSTYRCEQRVLIVGYTERYYRVRAANGPHWGENGYFRILRGGNKCGIEVNMYVVETSTRTKRKPGLNRITGCPTQYPVYCPLTRSCRSTEQRCIEPIEKKKAAPARTGPAQLAGLAPKLDPSLCVDQPGYKCNIMSRYCNISSDIRSRCGASCGVCDAEGVPHCLDHEDYEGQCAEYKRYCGRLPAVLFKCPVACGLTPAECAGQQLDFKVTVISSNLPTPPAGDCYLPAIPHGRPVTARALLNTGDELRVACEAGYTLVGDRTYCEIQNVYKPDTRRLPQCVRLASRKTQIRGPGADYAGKKSTAVSGRKCDNWVANAHTGNFRGVAAGREMLESGFNHNLCRNVGGAEHHAPYCYTRRGQIREYCWALPHCGGDRGDWCGAVRQDRVDCTEYNPNQCNAPDELKKTRAMWYWNHCPGMCCTHTGCQT